VYTSLGKTRPHASIDSTGIRVLHDQGPQRARRRHQDRGLTRERLQRSLKAERSEPITHTLETSTHVSRRPQTCCRGEAASKVHAGFAERLFSAASGKLPDQEGDQVGEASLGKLDRFEFRRYEVDLGRTPSSRSAPGAATPERNGEESGFRQSIEAATRDVSMNAERGGRLVRNKPVASAARVEKDPAKLRIASRCEAVERHGTQR
jgi:hypothetical protein